MSGLLGDPSRHFELGALGSVQFVLNTNAAALTSTMSVLIALVLLSVQLTAQRYSFNIIDIFIRSRINGVLIGYFILTITFNLWLGLLLDEDYIPTELVLLAMAMTTVGFALLPPYVIYLFQILRPNRILDRLQGQFLTAVRTGARPRDLTGCRSGRGRADQPDRRHCPDGGQPVGQRRRPPQRLGAVRGH